jgi:two-component system OmpR family response regulator
LRVLLVEDEAMNADLFVDALASDGHEVEVEHDGLDGLARATFERFDLIVLDMNLPRMSGAEICASLRASGLTTPIVALSASVLPNELEEGLRAGFDAYLTKPIAPTALRAAVRQYAKPA